MSDHTQPSLSLATTDAECKATFPIFSPSVYLFQHGIPPLGWHPSGSYVSKDCHNRYVTSFLIWQFEDEPEAGFPWELSLFSPAKGPRIGLSLLSQSKGKCLVCSDSVGHLMVTQVKYFGLHDTQYKKSIQLTFWTRIMSRRKWTDLLHRLHRPFVNNAIIRSAPTPPSLGQKCHHQKWNVENIWRACVNSLVRLLWRRRGFMKPDFAADRWRLLPVPAVTSAKSNLHLYGQILTLVSSSNIASLAKVDATAKWWDSNLKKKTPLLWHDPTRHLAPSLPWRTNFGKAPSSCTYRTCGITSILWRCKLRWWYPDLYRLKFVAWLAWIMSRSCIIWCSFRVFSVR